MALGPTPAGRANWLWRHRHAVLTFVALFLEELWLATRKTVLFITHSIDEAVLLSDRVLVMSPRPGRVEEIIAVGLPRPRGLEGRKHAAFAVAVDRITEIFLRRGVLHGGRDRRTALHLQE